MMVSQTMQPLLAAGYPPGPPGAYGPTAPGGYPPPGGHSPSGGYGGPVQAQPPGAPPGLPAAPKKSKAGLVIGIVAALVLLGGGAAAAWWFWLRSTGPELAKFMPKDTQVYIEVPSMTKALVGFVDVDWVDDAVLDPDKKKEDFIDAFASSFDITKDEAEAFVKGASSVGVALRDVNEKPKGGIFAAFGSASAVEPLLGSKRFDKDGEAAGGTKYKIYEREVDKDKPEKFKEYVEAALNEVGGKKDKDDKDDKKKDKDDDEEACIWWADQKVFGCGDLDFLEEVGKVMSGDKESLQKANESFAAAKWPAGSTLLVYVDPEVIKEKEIRKGYFDGVGPMLGSMRFTDAGLVMNARVELKGKKLRECAAELMEEPADLTLYERLPADTAAYYAFSTKKKGSYKEFEKCALKMAEEADENAAKQFDKGLEEMEKSAGFGLDDIYEALGDEGIIAVTASDKLTPEMIQDKDKEALSHVGLVIILHIADKEKAEKVLKEVRGKVEEIPGEMAEVKKQNNGFVVKTSFEDIHVSATIEEDKYLVVAAGQKKRVEAFKAAFAKEGDTLKADKAHAKAMKALSGKNSLVMWVDLGRVAKAALSDDKVKDELKEAGVPYKALKTEGDERVTGGFAARVAVKDGLWTVEIEDLNGTGVLPLVGFAVFAARKLPDLSGSVKVDPGLGGGGGSGGGGGVNIADIPVVGVAACDEYLAKAAKCVPGMTTDNLKQMADAWKKAAAIPSARSTVEQGCKQALDGIKQVPGCQ